MTNDQHDKSVSQSVERADNVTQIARAENVYIQYSQSESPEADLKSRLAGDPRPLVFISYASADGGAYARRLEADLRNHGYNTWWDYRQLKAGEDWGKAIEFALERADAVVVVLTAGAMRSQYVRKEYRYALRRSKKTIPVWFPGFERDDALYDIARIQWVDASEKEKYPQAFAELVAALPIILEPVVLPKAGAGKDAGEAPVRQQTGDSSPPPQSEPQPAPKPAPPEAGAAPARTPSSQDTVQDITQDMAQDTAHQDTAQSEQPPQDSGSVPSGEQTPFPQIVEDPYGVPLPPAIVDNLLPAPAKKPSVDSFSHAPLHFKTQYKEGRRLDESFAIEDSDSKFYGECGASIVHMIDDQTVAIDVWLFDMHDIRTETKLFVTDTVYNDPKLRNSLESNGELVRAEHGAVLTLISQTLKLEARITGLDVATSAAGILYFRILAIELLAYALEVDLGDPAAGGLTSGGRYRAGTGAEDTASPSIFWGCLIIILAIVIVVALLVSSQAVP